MLSTFDNIIRKESLPLWPIIGAVIDYVKASDGNRFCSLKPIVTGSCREGTRIAGFDFDLMLAIDDLEIHESSFQTPPGFTTVRIYPVGRTAVAWCRWQLEQWGQQQQYAGVPVMLNSTQVKEDFARLVLEAITRLGYGSWVTVESHGPAVTLTFYNGGVPVCKVDLVLAFKVKHWPEDAKTWKSRSQNVWPYPLLEVCTASCHVVPVHPKATNLQGKDVLWRYSFSAAEKELIDFDDRSSSCWKQVLCMLKDLKEKYLKPLKSHHLKASLFYEREANPHPFQWSHPFLAVRLSSCLDRLERCLFFSNCPNYFIPNQNLFEMFNPQVCLELRQKLRLIRYYLLLL